MSRDKILERYSELLVPSSTKARRLIQRLDYKNDPALLLRIAQTYLDECMFYDDGKQRDEIVWRKWTFAMKYAREAYWLDQKCLMVLSMLGTIWKAAGNYELAMASNEVVLQLAKEKDYSHCYGIDEELDQELINDSRFELYRLHFYTKRKLANKYLAAYKRGLERGVKTIYHPLEKYLCEE